MSRILTLINLGRTKYNDCLNLQRHIQKELADGTTGNTLLLTEHESVFTLGRNHPIPNLKVSAETIEEEGIPIIQTERGGDITYHGPGQLVAYGIIALREWELTAYDYINGLEEIMVRTLRSLGIKGERNPEVTRGIWVNEKKIGAVGISVKKGITMHGASLNISPTMAHLKFMNPCGFENLELTSIQKECERTIDLDEVAANFAKEFGLFFNAEITS